ncbi:hypothetical protein TCAL_08318 [Tigriopus californicus]|uniref:PPM-type phosphatase domain-containing protein n=1 Tax=Tigriopus californicus TaxID=6832 RepID=A0A553P9W2_TIGCA|nr:PP2C-like domain-containing protein CG9801 [Tigriopus californicus]TRY74463.1 hypothetical protein TCAL_08318 [Tigriopus californicus]|eukprot:TCALIF_08318-PA protein Name:"Similar to CG9801 PP2C-like domain-containing protein CG9801 (Drosophila melanogaster)" AED:0.02 eAED:0.02 QI:665/1/1/1/0.85/0.75/8/418/734
MPSIKQRVTGFIRQLSMPASATPATPRVGLTAASGHPPLADRPALGREPGPTPESPSGSGPGLHEASGPHDPLRAPQCFIKRYLSTGESHCPGPDILSGKTGHDLPILNLAELNGDIFAAFTGPEGGITSIVEGAELKNGPKSSSTLPEAAEDCEDFDYIDLDGLGHSVKSNHGGSKSLDQNQNPGVPLTTETVRGQRETSIESDYPELSGDILHWRSSIDQSHSIIHSSQMVARRLKLDLRNDTEAVIAGINHWYRPNNMATGQAITLYERHPYTAEHAGNPIADTFAIVARKNSAILVLGDGVNWGPKAALASRCAVHGCIEYLNQALFSSGAQKITTTQGVFQCLLRSFHAAHSLILREEAQLTTLTACAVLPVQDKERGEIFMACVCNVGDSLAYVYSPSNGHVREITQESHDIQSNRDMRDALGALGPVDGINPELSNLTCSLTEVHAGDIVFLTSDGVSDNFDPVVGKFCVPVKSNAEGMNRRKPKSASDSSLPTVEAYQRHELTLLRMEDILNHGPGSKSSKEPSSSTGRVNNSVELCHRMMDFCHRLTTAKRKVLEDPELYPDHTKHALPDSDATRLDQKLRRRKVCEKLAMVPGKLDHATIVAFTVEDRRQSLQNFNGTSSLPCNGTPQPVNSNKTEKGDESSNAAALLALLRAPCASSEDLTFRDEDEDDNEGLDQSSEATTPSDEIEEGVPRGLLSVTSSSPRSSHCGSLAVTPVHLPSKSAE